MAAVSAPLLAGDAREAVLHRGSHLQIIASAGSGKTEVVAQRVASLMADGADPAGIIAFTFTERAADELKARISARVVETLGPDSLDRLGTAFVGTIHAYCFRFLQQHVPRYETYDVLDEKRLTAFLTREAPRLHLKDLAGGRLFASIKLFLPNLEVVENELIAADDLDEPFRGMVTGFYGLLDQFRLLTYGQLIARAVQELQDPAVAGPVHATLRHLIVDEYQDVNPAQERLIELLTGPGVELSVVGDDDQAIYQWRGSDVQNIVGFPDRYPGVQTFRIVTNRRSRPAIVAAAAGFSLSIPGRLDKQMLAFRLPAAAELSAGQPPPRRTSASRSRAPSSGCTPPGSRTGTSRSWCEPGRRTRNCLMRSMRTGYRSSLAGGPDCSPGRRPGSSARPMPGW
jgi:DNA helicase-2/ATP-dependent DNA helicase PcrA